MNLQEQLASIDYKLLEELFQLTKIQSSNHEEHDYQPMEAVDLKNHPDRDKYEALGIDAISEGKLAVVLMAGGQGSRLGFDGPKGAYDIGLATGESLFELQAQTLLSVCKKADRSIKWYIMTSDTNHKETIEFFKEHAYFGYNAKDIAFFQQGMLPAVNEKGEIVFESENQIAFSPNGNGGIFLALRDHGLIRAMRNDGVDWVFIYGVDNPLVKIADPMFFGYTLASGHKAGSKIVKKLYPEERVGVVCYRDKKPAIVEYSELGSLNFELANIANHLIHLDVIEKHLDEPMTYHVAHKYVEGINVVKSNDGSRQPNAYKFETFIFDIFAHCEDMAVVEVLRDEEFAPVKNREGQDSPESARKLVEAMRGLK